MRASRLVSMLLLLQTRGRMTATELALELDVSVRTVYRDVESLSAAGVPVYADRGPAGGYQLLDGYRTRLTGLTSEEAESLFLAGVPGPAAALGLGTVLAAAQLKLMAALPPELRSRAERIRERFHLDAPGWFHDGDPPRHLAEVAAAVWNQRRVQVSYRRWNNSEVERTLEPLGVVLKAGVWYVVANVPAGEEPRTYRASRVLAVRTLDDRFERPAGFELAAYWQAWTQRLQRVLFHGEATVRFAPRAVELSFLLGPVVGRVIRAAAERPDPDGWVTAVIPIESVEHALHDLLRFGPDAEVLEPRQLRARIAGAARGLVRLYDR
ncbi:MAG TPA: YafY family protein [Pseudonocardiaceae bacterium]|nr:YafY family protein [Pseudonocardiaceae bacterium]